MIKVGALVELPQLGLVVRAHRAGLDAWVRWAHVLEDFEGITRLTGGELVLTTGRWRRTIADDDRFVCGLAQRGAVALAMPVLQSAEAAQSVAAACERWHVVLIEIAPGRTCEEISEAAITAIMDSTTSALVDGMRRERSLLDALMSQRGVRPILDAMAAECGLDAWLMTHAAVFTGTGQQIPSGAWLSQLVEHTKHNPSEITTLMLHSGEEALIFPVRGQPHGSRVRAHLVCEVSSERMTGAQRAGVDQTLGFLAVELSRQARIRALRQGCGRELIRRAGTGDASVEELMAWMRMLEVTTLGHVVCVVAHAQRATVSDISDLATALDDVADELGAKSIVATGDGEAVMFMFPAEARARETDDALSRARLLIPAYFGRLRITIGTSSAIAKEVGDLTNALIDARQVCRLNALHEPEPAAFAQSQPPPPPLCALLLAHDEQARLALEQALIGPLLAYDAKHGSDLLNTLDVFLTSSGQWTVSASQLGVHVNTLRYRLARVEQITGRDLNSMADRVDFYIALRAREADAAAGRAGEDSMYGWPASA